MKLKTILKSQIPNFYTNFEAKWENKLTSWYFFLPRSTFCFRIVELGLRFSTFELLEKKKKSKFVNDYSWNYYQDSSNHIS